MQRLGGAFHLLTKTEEVGGGRGRERLVFNPWNIGGRKLSCQYNKSHRQFQPPSGAKGAARAYVLKKAMKSVGDSLLA